MKKFIIVAVILGGISFTSCKKCKVCTVYREGVEVEKNEKCDEDLDKADQEDNYNTIFETGTKCE